MSAWAKGAPAPTGASFGAEIYKRLPNDTDFTVFKTIGASGLNFAPVADSYAYHTDRDIAPRVEAGTLNHEIGNTIETVRALDAMEWTRRAEPPTFFDVFGARATVYGDMAGRVLMGSALASAALAWLVVSSLFSWYLGNFANYNATYGALGAVVGLMMWMWLSTIVVLVGAELNSEIEHQTAHDTTVGPARPLGVRGAVMADTVGAGLP